jgi:hypothetical protein
MLSTVTEAPGKNDTSMARTAVSRFGRTMLAVEQKWPYLLAFLSAIFLVVTLLQDSARPLWNDELFTFYISRQNSLGDVWKALLTGAEQLPLFFFAIVRLFRAIFGSGSVALRLPETIGFLVMNISIFLFVRKRVPASYALLGFLFPSVTQAYYFAYEARPYGLVMGFGSLAMLCWQNAVQGRRRPLSLAGLAFSLACAFNCHYYAVLLLFPFGLAELVRYWERRRFDFATSIAIAVSIVPLVFSLPVIRAASNYSSHFWAKPSWTLLISFYEDLLMPSGFALLLIGIISGLVIYFRRDHDIGESRVIRVPAHEFALAIGFVLLPTVAICLAKFVTGAFTSRYAIYAVIGLSLLVAWSFARIGRGSNGLGLLLASALAFCSLIIGVRQYQQFRWNALLENQTFEYLASTGTDLPLVVLSPHQFFVQSHRASVNGRGHLIYLGDVPLALKYTGTDTVERGLLTLRNYAPLDVEDYHRFIATHQSFLAYGYPDPFGWVLEDLMQSGWRVSVKGRHGASLLYLVQAPANSVAVAGSAR